MENKKLKEDMGMEFDRFRMIGSDSQEKLGMVKDFIDNIEERFRVEIGSLEERMEKIIKIQEKQELEKIAPLKLGRRKKAVTRRIQGDAYGKSKA